MYNKNEIEKIKESFRKDFNLSKDDERYLDITINYNNKTTKGIMYGNDECFSGNNFYQYLVTDDNRLLKCFYETQEGIELDSIDYENPEDVQEISDYIDCII